MAWSHRSYGVPRAKITVADDLPGSGRVRVETVASDRGLEASGRHVQLAQQIRRAAQGEIGPGVRREPVPVPGFPLRVHGDVPVEIGEHFGVALDAQRPSFYLC